MGRQAVVLAGGLGTRLLPVTGGRIPKALVPVLGRPFIDIKLRSLRELDVTNVMMLIGEGGDQIVDHVGDGRGVGIEVDYAQDGEVLLGTAGTIRAALHRLDETFWITYGDSLCVADLASAEARLHVSEADALMTVYENCDRWDPSNVAHAGGVVTEYRKVAEPGTFRWIDYGLLYFRASAFESLAPGVPTDLSAVLDPLVARRSVLAFPVADRFWEIGTPEGLAATETHLADLEGR